MENLDNLKYKDLQKLAKEAGIKANSPKAVLIESLREVENQKEAEAIKQDLNPHIVNAMKAIH